jgi:hypothetical protein
MRHGAFQNISETNRAPAGLRPWNMNRFLKKTSLNPAFKIVQPLPRLNPDCAERCRSGRAAFPKAELEPDVSLALAGQGRALRPRGERVICVIQCTDLI